MFGYPGIAAIGTEQEFRADGELLARQAIETGGGDAVGILLVPPYLFMYDYVTLAVAMAFLFREMQATGARPGEYPALLCALLLMLIFPLVKLPVGFVAAVIVAMLIARRVLKSINRHSGAARSAEPGIQGQA